jgi:hypothetical protein
MWLTSWPQRLSGNSLLIPAFDLTMILGLFRLFCSVDFELNHRAFESLPGIVDSMRRPFLSLCTVVPPMRVY